MKIYAYDCFNDVRLFGNLFLVEQEIARGHRYYNTLIGLARDRRRELDAAGEDPVLVAAALGRWGARTRAERARRGCAWGTGGEIEAAAMAAITSSDSARGKAKKLRELLAEKPEDVKLQKSVARWERRSGLHTRPWTGEGSIAVQFVQKLSVKEVISGDDTQIRMTSPNGHWTCEIRVGSDPKRKPIWAAFPVRYDRPLPPSGVVSSARVVRRKVGEHYRYQVQIAVQEPGASRVTAPIGSIVAIDVGWRKFEGEGMRVAVWAGSDGAHGELRLPQSLCDYGAKPDELRSLRDRLFNAARDRLCALRREATDWPADLLRETQYAHAWREPTRMAGIVLRWAATVPALAEFVAPHGLDHAQRRDYWRDSERHLHEWEDHQRKKAIRKREEIYRLFARELATRYEVVTIEDLDLRDFAELPAPEEKPEDPRTRAARPRRFDAALSTMVGALKNALGRRLVKLDPSKTTITCSRCGHVEAFDAAGSVRHRCGGCQAEWDQDENAAENLLRAGGAWLASGGRSKLEAPEIAHESKRAQKRRAGKTKKKLDRSQELG